MQWQFAHPKHLPTWLLFAMMFLMSVIPMKIQWFIGQYLGDIVRILARSRYKIAYINISKCYPKYTEHTIKKLTKQHFKAIGISFFEIADCFFMSDKRLKKHYKIIGIEYLKLVENNNIIFLIGHFTTMMIAGRMLKHQSHFADIYRPQNNVLFDYLMKKRIKSYGIDMVSAKNTKKMLKTLKSGVAIWYAHDQDLGKKSSVFVDFFNITTATITATARFAKVPNTKVIPLSFWREKTGYVLKFDSALNNYPSGNDLSDAARTNKILENQIKNVPEQYGWIHKRFKTRPNNEKYFY